MSTVVAIKELSPALGTFNGHKIFDFLGRRDAHSARPIYICT